MSYVSYRMGTQETVRHPGMTTHFYRFIIDSIGDRPRKGTSLRPASCGTATRQAKGTKRRNRQDNKTERDKGVLIWYVYPVNSVDNVKNSFSGLKSHEATKAQRKRAERSYPFLKIPYMLQGRFCRSSRSLCLPLAFLFFLR